MSDPNPTYVADDWSFDGQPDRKTIASHNTGRQNEGTAIPTVCERIDEGSFGTTEGPHAVMMTSTYASYDQISEDGQELQQEHINQQSVIINIQCAADGIPQSYHDSQIVVPPVQLQTYDKIWHFIGPIIVSFCVIQYCCVCFGTIAMYYAVVAKLQSRRGDIEEATLNAEKSYHCSLIGFIVGLTILIVLIVAAVTSGVFKNHPEPSVLEFVY